MASFRVFYTTHSKFKKRRLKGRSHEKWISKEILDIKNVFHATLGGIISITNLISNTNTKRNKIAFGALKLKKNIKNLISKTKHIQNPL